MIDRASLRMSVVYPTCGRPRILLRSIRALLAHDAGPDEVVVVDQSGSDETGRALSDLGDPRIVRVVSDERGLSRARNLGIRASRYPIIGFLDDDCIPAPDWIESATGLITGQPRVSIWVGVVVHDERGLSQPAVPRTLTLGGIRDPWRHDPTGGNSFLRRSVFERIGGFDPLLGQGSTFPGAEDGDLIYRALRAGIRVTYSDTIRCFHVPWRDETERLHNRYNYGCGVGAMLAKYARPGERSTMLFIFVRHFLKKFLLVPYRRVLGPRLEYRRNLNYSRGVIDGFRGWRRLDATAAPGPDRHAD